MNKLWLIIQREYLTRVTRKSFILATLLTPLAFGLLFVVVGVIFSYQSDDVRNIVIKDEGNLLKKALADSKNLYFTFSNESIEELKERYNNKEFDGILLLPAPQEDDLQKKKWTVTYLADKPLEPEASSKLRSELEKRLRLYRMEQLGIDEKTLNQIEVSVTIDPDQVNKKEGQRKEEKAFTSLTSAVASGLGMVIGILMYMMVFINGSMVMRSVMEEKTSRIVEVMVSSVKPFQLMLGKLVGVGAVGITQLLIWAILIFIISIAAGSFFTFGSNPQAMIDMAQASGAAATDLDNFNPLSLIEELRRMNWFLIGLVFILFFIGGYFIYSSLFAAVGSAMSDDMGEGQALTIPITIPVLLAFYIMIVAVRSPNSTLAVWASIFPLFSPIVMPARIAFDPPWWQILISFILMVGTALFFVWVSARIYRVGILMYGKKATFKDLKKWFFYKG